MRFLLDENVPKSAATALRQEGHDVVRAQEADLQSADDESIWRYAVTEDRILITYDLDFPLAPGFPAGLILVRGIERIPTRSQTDILVEAIRAHSDQLEGHITVVAPGRVRRRKR